MKVFQMLDYIGKFPKAADIYFFSVMKKSIVRNDDPTATPAPVIPLKGAM